VGAVLAAALVQGIWLPRLAIHGEWPDLATTTALLVALLFGIEAGWPAAATAGLALGWTVGLALPAFVVSRLVGVAAVSPLRVAWRRDSLWAQMAAVFLGALVTEACFVVCSPGVLEAGRWLERVVLRAGLDTLCVPVLVYALARLPIPEDTAHHG
jgi:hypothetical protein